MKFDSSTIETIKFNLKKKIMARTWERKVILKIEVLTDMDLDELNNISYIETDTSIRDDYFVRNREDDATCGEILSITAEEQAK